MDNKFFGFLAGFPIGLICHETGHLLGCIAVSVPARILRVGIGPRLLHARVRETRLELRLYPFGGVVETYPVLVYSRYRMMLVFIGGILGNAAVISLVGLLASLALVPYQFHNTVWGIVLAQYVIIAFAVVPFGTRRDGAWMGSDGLIFLKLLLWWRGPIGRTPAGVAYAAALSPYGEDGKQPHTLSPASSRISYYVTRLGPSTDIRRDAQQALLRELARSGLPPAEEMLVLDALITSWLLFLDPILRPRIDELSLRALRFDPELETLRGSRGAVLVQLGHSEAGKAMLEPIAASVHAKPFDALVSQLFLARAEHALGHSTEARRLVSAARTKIETASDPKLTFLLAQVEAELGSAP